MNEKESAKEDTFKCEICKMTFPTRAEYEKHLRKEHTG